MFIASEIFPLTSVHILWPEKYGRSLVDTSALFEMSSVRWIFQQNSFDSLQFDSFVNTGSASDMYLKSIRLN
jgi:hypothetical protein